MNAIGIVGPGRAGVGLGLALSRSGHTVFIHGRRPKALPAPLELSWGGIPPWLDRVQTILLAVPDDALPPLIEELARSGRVGPEHTVLHLSGVLDWSVLAPLAGSGAALGSLHPLQSLADPLRVPELLRGAVAAVEGDPRAVERAGDLARSLGLRPVEVPSSGKVIYHAGAVFAANYLVVVGAIAERLLVEAGFGSSEARAALTPLIAGSVENLREKGPRALTGPVARGDADTVRMHLATLPRDLVEPYRALARAALEIAELSEEKKRAIEEALAANR
ncbi:MAG: Rossmann-like and DUF2520 domain-containing protein [Gemmatimonadales bacterium]